MVPLTDLPAVTRGQVRQLLATQRIPPDAVRPLVVPGWMADRYPGGPEAFARDLAGGGFDGIEIHR